MKLKLLSALAVLSLLLSAQSGVTAEKTDASAELKALKQFHQICSFTWGDDAANLGPASHTCATA
jgi:hypothetical protein